MTGGEQQQRHQQHGYDQETEQYGRQQEQQYGGEQQHHSYGGYQKPDTQEAAQYARQHANGGG
jgi:hypothetical protein